MKARVAFFVLVGASIWGCGGGGISGPSSQFAGTYIGMYSTDLVPNAGTVSGAIDSHGHLSLTTVDAVTCTTSTFDGKVVNTGAFVGKRTNGPINTTCDGTVSFQDVQLNAEIIVNEMVIATNIHMVLDRR